MERTILYLDQVDSTNTWVKQNFAKLADGDAVWTQSQTAGRGRLGRSWQNLPGCGLFYTAVVRRDLAQPACLPLYASVAAARVLEKAAGVQTMVKWPNDLLLGGKKLVGILCEGVPGGWLCGIGFNLAHPQAYFDQNDLPHGTSLLLQGIETARQPEQLARAMVEELNGQFGEGIAPFAEQGFAAIREEYLARCVNLGRPVEFDGGRGMARDIDHEGRLVVDTEDGSQAVFTGEVSVRGIYGCV